MLVSRRFTVTTFAGALRVSICVALTIARGCGRALREMLRYGFEDGSES